MLLSILSITVYEKGEGPKPLLSWRIVTLGPLSKKDMVIIAKYEVKSNEDRTVFIYEQRSTELSALRK